MIDYIFLPFGPDVAFEYYGTLQDLPLTINGQQDHLPVVLRCRLSGRKSRRSPCKVRPKGMFQSQAFRAKCFEFWNNAPPVVAHSAQHFCTLVTNAMSSIQEQFRGQRAMAPTKPWISDDTWAQLQVVLDLRRQRFRAYRLFRTLSLKRCFLA